MRAFSGKTVVVTGAAAGIGRALAFAFASAGARVALLDLDPAGAEKAAADLGADAMGLACDVRDPARCREAIARVVTAFGGVDVLVNNAGISHRSLFADTSLEVVRRVMDVNFFGAVHCTHAALPSLIERRGQVIAISSVAGFAPLIGRTGYAASKHALHGFFDSLRTEIEPRGVGVLLVCPSFVDTGIDKAALGADGAPLKLNERSFSRKATAGKLLAPEQVALAVVKAALRRERLLVLGPVGKASWWLSRLAPGLYARIMTRNQGGEFGAGGR